MKQISMVASVAGALALALTMIPAPVAAQCCGTVCVDADNDGAADDSIRCDPLVAEGVLDLLAAPNRLAGCNQEHPSENLACVGGEVLTGGTLLNGCACLLPALGGDCFDGSGNPLTAAGCSAAAATACSVASGATETIDDPACGTCPTCPAS